MKLIFLSGRQQWLSNICPTIRQIHYFQSAADVTWVPYNKLHVGDYEKAHYDKVSDVVVLKVNSKENTYTRAIMYKWTMDSLELENTRYSEIQAHFAEVKY